MVGTQIFIGRCVIISEFVISNICIFEVLVIIKSLELVDKVAFILDALVCTINLSRSVVKHKTQIYFI